LFSLEDPEKIIDKIKPEQVAEASLKLLGHKLDYDFRTVYIGAKYLEKHFEIIPNGVGKIDDVNAPLVIRMDYGYDEDNLIKQLSVHNHCYIITSKPFDVKNILPYKEKIKQIQYNFKKDYDINFVKNLYESGIGYGLNCELPKENNEHIKLDFMDYGVVEFEEVFNPKEASEFDNVDLDNLYYKSCKILSSQGRNYYGKQSWSMNDEVKQFGELKKVKNTVDFWKEVDYCMLLEKIN